MLIQRLEQRILFTTYYVSPAGSDLAAGTDSGVAWRTIAKVNASSFAPGDFVLFERGGQWRESLAASSSGTVGNPITFGAYGNGALARPLFIGSDEVANAAFSPVAGTASTFSTPASAVDWVYDNHHFLRCSNLVIASDEPAENLNFVNANSGSFYFSGSALYVNVGAALDGHLITVGKRDDAVACFVKGNLVFTELATTETARLHAGYGFRAQSSENIQFIGCTATLAGKHHFGAIGVNGFLGKDLIAAEASPDLGEEGASAYVSFSGGSRLNDAYEWINIDWQTPNGPYPIFISHGTPGSIASLLLQNLTSSGVGAGIACYSTGPQETVTIRGGHINQGVVRMGTDNTLIDGLLVTGATGSVALNGQNAVLKNSRFDGVQPNPGAGRNGAVSVFGQNSLITSNLFRFDAVTGPAVNILNSTTNTTIRGNVFDCPDPYWLMFNGDGAVSSNRNLVRDNVRVESGDLATASFSTWSQWQAAGQDQQSVAAPVEAFVYGSTDLSIAGAALAIVPNNDGAGGRLYGVGTTGGLFYGQDAALDAMLLTAALAGDTNLDGVVDVADLGNLASNYGTTGGIRWRLGDLNYDGQVATADLGDLASAYGQSGGPSAGQGGGVSFIPAEIVAASSATNGGITSDFRKWKVQWIGGYLNEQSDAA